MAKKNKSRRVTLRVELFHQQARTTITSVHDEENAVLFVRERKTKIKSPGLPEQDVVMRSVLFRVNYDTWDKANESYESLTN